MRERAETDYRNTFKYAEAKGRAEGEARGEARGRTEGRVETARNLLQMGFELDKISQATQLSLDELKGLMAED